jgi:hypothetical protein
VNIKSRFRRHSEDSMKLYVEGSKYIRVQINSGVNTVRIRVETILYQRAGIEVNIF